MRFVSSLLITILCFSHSIHANEQNLAKMPDTWANIEAEPSTFIHGCVNAITGDYVESAVDIYIPGVDPLVLQRCYVSSDQETFSPSKGWRSNHQGFLNGEYDSSHYLFCDMQGSQIRFLGSETPLSENKGAKLHPDPEIFSRGVTNCANGKISAQNNLKNFRLFFHKQEIQVEDGAKTNYKFTKKHGLEQKIERIKFPNGNRILYEYHKHHGLSSIKAVSAAGRTTGVIQFAKPCFKSRKSLHSLTTEDGQQIEYISRSTKYAEPDSLIIKSSHTPLQTYIYTNQQRSSSEDSDSKITRKELPDDRFKQIYYYHYKDTYPNTKKRVKQGHGRVNFIQEPAGHDQAPIKTAQFIYELDKKSYGRKLAGKTFYYDALKHQTIYHFNEEERLTAIERFQGTGSYALRSCERLYWGSKQTVNHTNLISRTLEAADGGLLFCRHFKYDQKGNIVADSLYGNLQGYATGSLIVDATGNPQASTCDHSTVQYTYTNDDYNLMTSETNQRHQIKYRYDQRKNLSSKFICHQGIKQRYFYAYDDHGALCKEIEDDGTSEDQNSLQGVTQRKIKYLQNTDKLPAGLPKVIEEKYLDLASQQEILLHKVINSYNVHGQLQSQSYYDSTANLVYTLYWEYDNQGNLIKEVDALNRVTTRSYDSNKNKIFEQGPCLDYCFHYRYDFMNRLICQERVCADGKRLAEHFSYDHLGNRITSTDIYGFQTKYEYNARRLVNKIIQPEVFKEDHLESPITSHQYDLMGNQIETINAEKEKTVTNYNLRGKPTSIRYADQSIEMFYYTLDGHLKRHYAKNGLLTVYTYDYLARPVKTESYAANGELLAIHRVTYNAFHQLTEVDAEGMVTNYSYDGAGRLAKIVKGCKQTSYFYDAMGRVKETREASDATHFMAHFQFYDVLNQLIEEQTQDENGMLIKQLNYAYDSDGNRCLIASPHSTGSSITHIRYNALKQPIEITDALGHSLVTTFVFPHEEGNKRTLKTETTDPQGNRIITLKDPLGRLIVSERRNLLNQLMQHTKNSYDLMGRLTKSIETIYTPGEPERQLVNCWRYDEVGRLIQLIEAENTPLKKETTYLFNETGEKAAVIKPDGTIIHYTYDSWGRLACAKSSDGTIEDHYSYDLSHALIRLEDKIRGLITHKQYDRNKRLAKEILATGIELNFTYDGLDQLICLQIPDQGKIDYQYQGNRLEHIERYDQEQQLKYSHHYTGYDHSGRVAQAKLIGQAGYLNCTYDLLGRLTDNQAEAWKETNLSYDPSGNLLNRQVDEGVQSTCHYLYDDLYQLKSEQVESAREAYTHSYAHDSHYNRVAKNETQLQINSLDQLITAGDTHYTYDRNGRLIVQKDETGEKLYSYDALDRLISVEQDSANRREQFRYTYDAENRRLLKQHFLQNGQEWQLQESWNYLYQGQNEIGCYDQNNQLIELRVLGSGKGAEIGAAIAIEKGDQCYAPIHDLQGNVVCLVDYQTGLPVERYSYSAFGTCQVTLDAGIDNPWRFSSKRYDPETNWTYFGRRYYDAATGRWTTPDPIGFEGGANLYAYLLNNPLTHIDLYGLADANASTNQQADPGPRNIVERIVRKAGEIIRMIGNHCIPIPGVRRVISRIGHWLAGGTSANYRAMNIHSPSRNHYLNRPGFDNVRVIAVNGILCECDDNKEMCQFISDQYGGIRVDGAYNSSHGFFLDLLECIAQKLGFRTRSVMLLVNKIKMSINELGGVVNNPRIIVHASSQGGLTTDCALKYLTAEEKACLEVHTYGSAKIISSEGLAEATNYINTCDPIPWVADPVGCLKAVLSSKYNVHFLKSNKFCLDHGLLASENYRNQIVKNGEIFKKEYGL